MSKFHEVMRTDHSGPFEEAALFAYRFSAMLIMDSACTEVAQLEHDVEIGLSDLGLPEEIKAQVMIDYSAIRERWKVLLAAPLCVD